MKTIIVGGTGLIGRALTTSLLAGGDEVLVLSRGSGCRSGFGSRAAVVRWSPGQVDALAGLLAGADAIVNLAGAPVGPLPWTPGRRRVIASSRIDSTRAIVDALARLAPEARPGVLVVVSGVDAYPETTAAADPRAATESSTLGSGFLAQITRGLEGEACRAEGLGVRVVRLRLGHVLAREAKLLRILALPVRLFIGGRIGDGRQWVSWIHIDDAVALLRCAISDDRYGGCLNAVAPGACRQVDVVRAMARILRRPALVPIPSPLVRLVMREQAVLLLGSHRVAPRRAIELGFEFRFPTIERAMEEVLR